MRKEGEASEKLKRRKDENEPDMLLKNYMYDGDGRPLYLSSEVIVGTRYQISV